MNLLVAVPEHPPCQRAIFRPRCHVGCKARGSPGQASLGGHFGRPIFVRVALAAPPKEVPMPNAFAPDSSHPSDSPLFAGAALLHAEKLD